MEGYREMGEIPSQKKKTLKSIFQQAGNPHFWKFSFGVNCSGGGTLQEPQPEYFRRLSCSVFVLGV